MSDTDTQAEIVDVIGPLRRYVGAHARGGQDVDDVVQETLTRVIGARERLAPGVALAYSIVVARNVMADQLAEADRVRRNAHRMIDLTQPARPDDTVVRIEENAALVDALADVEPAQRELLLAHVLNDEPVSAIATDTGSTSGSVAAQLARTRARLRVDYVLALRGVDLPTPRCRPVLLAISASDTRRQEVLRAGQHLLNCSTCSSVSEPLLRRRSALAAILPWLGLGPALGWVRRLVQNSPGQAAATAAGGTALGAVAVVVAVHSASAPAPAPSTTAPATAPASWQLVRASDRTSLLPVPAGLRAMAGDRVTGTGVPVEAVAANEGFWIGDRARGRIWVQLTHTGRESAVTVKAGDKVSFTGTVAANGSGFARRTGVTAAEGAALLEREGVHLSVDEHALHLSK